jgi:hypothetical protein
MFVCCPLYFNYHLSFDFGNGIPYHLFDSKDHSPGCSHDLCPSQSSEIDIDLLKIDIETKEKSKFLTMKKEFRCALSCLCACCTRPTMEVFIGDTKIGKISDRQTVCDPLIYVFNYLNDLKYVITGSFCQCGFCLRDKCFSDCCKECNFEIYDRRDLDKKSILGTIRKIKKSGEKIRPDFDELVIDLPKDANSNDKILILCATFLIECLYFQNHSNSKRCHGDPLD